MKEKVIDFIKVNSTKYPEYFINDRLNKIKFGYTSDIDQIYYYLDSSNINKSGYYEFYKITKKYFNINDRYLLEVASGLIPILAGIFKDKNCKIDASNLDFSVKNYKNVNMIKCDLSKKINLSKYDLIIGYRSCEITENIIDLCYEYSKNFIFYLCPCDNKPNNKNIKITKDWNYNNWHNYLIEKIKRNSNYDLRIIYNKNMPDNCPIIIGKYNK